MPPNPSTVAALLAACAMHAAAVARVPRTIADLLRGQTGVYLQSVTAAA